MPRRRRTDWRIEAVEERVLLSPVKFADVRLPGANPNATPAWDYSMVGGAASPIMADLNGDGRDEIIVAAANGHLYAYTWNVSASNPGGSLGIYKQYALPARFNPGKVIATPAVATLRHGGKAIFAATTNGQVWGWNALTGSILPGWPRNVGYDAPPGYSDKTPQFVAGPIAVGDLDGDQIPEIVVTSFNELVTAYNFNGSVKWRFANDESIYGGAIIADLQGDGTPEVVFAGDSQALTPYYWNGGRITALTSNGQRAWVKRTDQSLWSSPVAVDLDGNGTLEIVVGTGFFFPQPNPDVGPFPGNMVYAVDHRGNDVPGWPFITSFNANVDARVFSSPAVADLNGDGYLDVVITDNREIMTAISGNPAHREVRGGRLQPGVLWQVQAFPSSPQKIYTSPIIVDINGDGHADVVQANGGGRLRGFDGRTGATLFEYTDNPADGLGHQHLNAPAVGKFKPGDRLQLAIAPITTALTVGRTLWPGSLVLFDIDVSPQNTVPWPQFRGNAESNAIARSEIFLRPLITRLYTGALGRTPAEREIQIWINFFRREPSLSRGITAIISGPEARSRLINGWFVKYLGIEAKPAQINQYSAAIRGGATHAGLQRTLLSSAYVFNQVNGGHSPNWIRYLYRKTHGRPATNAEVNAWVAFLNARGGGGTLSARLQVAGAFVTSFPFTVQTVQDWYRTFLGNRPLPLDGVYAASWDLRRGRQEEVVLQSLIAANGDYIAAHGEGSWIRALYQDLLQRSGSPAEITQFLSALERGVSMRNVAATFLHSVEYRRLYVRAWYTQLLGRSPNAGELQSYVRGMGNGASRAQVLTTIIASNEYFARNGGSVNGFVVGAFRDLMGFTPDQTALNFWRTRAAEGQNIRLTLPQHLLGGGYVGGYFKNVINGWFYNYLRRYPNTPAHQGRIFESDAFHNYGAAGFVNYLAAGGNEIDVQLALLTSPEYIHNIARRKGFWYGQRWLA